MESKSKENADRMRRCLQLILHEATIEEEPCEWVHRELAQFIHANPLTLFLEVVENKNDQIRRKFKKHKRSIKEFLEKVQYTAERQETAITVKFLEAALIRIRVTVNPDGVTSRFEVHDLQEIEDVLEKPEQEKPKEIFITELAGFDEFWQEIKLIDEDKHRLWE